MLRISCLAALLLGACVTVPSESGADGGGAGFEIGLIAVHRSEPQAEPKLVQVSRLGGWASQSGMGLGYKKSTMVELDGECRVVFLIENEEQLKKAVDLVKSTLNMSGGDICVTG